MIQKDLTPKFEVSVYLNYATVHGSVVKAEITHKELTFEEQEVMLYRISQFAQERHLYKRPGKQN